MSQTKDMSGALFREGEKRSERSPDYTGHIMVAGTAYRLAGWVREKEGRKFLSLAVSEPRAKGSGQQPRPAADEVPF